MEVITIICFVLAAIPAVLFLWNIWLYRRPRSARAARVSVLIPARNEEASIRAAVESVLGSEGVEVEVIVGDDHSTDRTAEIARATGARVVSVPALPTGWCGKQHACWVLSREARHDLLLFLDADVRLERDGLARLVGFLEQSGADLVSGIPRQITGTWLEKVLIPLIHFVLLGFLPMIGMRRTRLTGFAAGCGQMFLARRSAYEKAGGHAAIRASRHDGVTLPRAFRRAGFKTDLCDATDVAVCRMYCNAGEVWRGLAKNATEGLGAPGAIGVWTVLLVGGQVVPVVVCLCAQVPEWMWGAVALGYVPRVIAAVKYRQSWLGVLLHPAGVLVLMAIQWRALVGGDVGWKGRVGSRAIHGAAVRAEEDAAMNRRTTNRTKPALDGLREVQ